MRTLKGWRAMLISGIVMISAVAAWSDPAVAQAPAAVGARWPQFQGVASHRGLNPLETDLNVTNVSELALSWVGHVPGDLDWTSPVVMGDNVYINGGDAGLVVFPAAGCGAATCEPTWQGQTGPQAIAAPAVAGGIVFSVSQASFTSNDGRLNAFDAAGCGAPLCQPVWTGIGGTESFLVSSPAIARSTVYVGSFDGMLYAFDGRGCGSPTCQPLWTGQTGSPIDSSPAVAGGTVYVGSTNGRLSAFPADGCGSATCSPLWQGLTGGSIDIASPTIAGGVALVSGGDFLFAFDAAGCGAATCQPLWKGKAELMSNTPAVAGGVVYVDAQPLLQGGRSVGVVEAFALHGCGASVCDPLWSGINFTTGPESSPVVAGGVVYIGKGPASFLDSGVFAYDARGCGQSICESIGFAQTGPRQFYLSSTPAVVDGRVYMGSTQTANDQAGLYVFERP